MVRVVTQETYDEVVKENIEEFEMTPAEAIKDAVAQFEAQGVDLSNIIKDLALRSEDEHLVSTTIGNLKKLSFNNTEAISNELKILKQECEKDIAHRLRAGKEGAYGILINILENNSNVTSSNEITYPVLNALGALMDSQPDLLDEKGVNLIIRFLDGSNSNDEQTLVAVLKWMAVCCVKHERNRQTIFNKDITKYLKPLLSETSSSKVLTNVLQMLRKFTLDDDLRVEFGKAHEHAKEIALHTLDDLTNLMKVRSKPPLVSELMLTMAALLVRHELCQRAAAAGVVDALFTVLTDNYENVGVALQGLKLVTALAGADDVKRQLVRGGMAPLVTSLLRRHASNATLAATALKCMAALSLREPEHSGALFDAGAPDAVLSAMKIHADVASVQKNACWAIRNMVARRRDQNAKFHELGAEEVLSAAYRTFGCEFGFDIKSALRDLGCDVKLEEQWTGAGVQLVNE